ncbi:MAG TPA: DUF1493 family protein, partial [Terricaulis sp.]|nr:DUF1493 family protein [Terricaulis sp.]
SDLGLDGDPAGAFMQAFKERFAVDMESFIWLRYFGDEGWDMLKPLIVALARLDAGFDQRWRAALAEEREITLSHLVDVAQAKSWIHPGPAHAPLRKPSRLAALLVSAAAIGVAVFAVLYAVAVYGLAIGALGEVSWVTAAALIAAAAFPTLLIRSAWSNIQRKLASAPAS